MTDLVPTQRQPGEHLARPGNHPKENAMSQAQLNTEPPPVRCGMCGRRCRPDPLLGPRWIECRAPRCYWSSHSPRRVGWIWRLRIWLGR